MLLVRLLLAIAINAVALWIANILWDSVSIHGFWAYFIGALVLGIAPNFSIDGFWTYVGVVVIVWLVNWVAHAALEELDRGDRRTRFA